MHTNTAGVNRKWAEPQGEGSVSALFGKEKQSLRTTYKSVWIKRGLGQTETSASCSWLVVSFISPPWESWGSYLHISGYFQATRPDSPNVALSFYVLNLSSYVVENTSGPLCDEQTAAYMYPKTRRCVFHLLHHFPPEGLP